MTVLKAESLAVAVPGRRLCRGLELTLAPGQCWGLLGANGIGKTTLLHTLAGLRLPVAGGVSLDGEPLQILGRKSLARRIGVLFQDSQDTFPATVLETALSGRYPHLPLWGLESERDVALAREALAQVGLADLDRRRVDTLSGGERRRLAVAILLVQSPAVLLLDEPTNHLDLHYQITLLSLLTERTRRGGTLLMSLHDVNLVTRFCSHALLMVDADTLIAGSVDQVISTGNLKRLYRHGVREVEEGGRRYYFPD
ncbi:MAG: ABC transporter ATP-binding protein [Gammaproteobacteria bacterium]